VVAGAEGVVAVVVAGCFGTLDGGSGWGREYLRKSELLY
jgi:hypothetical protein